MTGLFSLSFNPTSSPQQVARALWIALVTMPFLTELRRLLRMLWPSLRQKTTVAVFMVGLSAQQTHGASLKSSLLQYPRAVRGHAHLTDVRGKGFQTSFGARVFDT